MSEGKPPIIVRRVKKVVGGHHGGAWKVAYADFVTAMMAFFLVLWLVGAASKEEKAAISEYFRNPSAFEGTAQMPGASSLGPGGASDRMIPTAGAVGMAAGIGPQPGQLGRDSAVADAQAQADARDREQLDELREELEAAIQASQALAPFKDQLLIDLTPEGLRIQIVDRLNRPMFDLGGGRLKDYADEILRELGSVLARRPQRIALSGHTDETPFHAPDGYGNWELSSDRANAARRALVRGGLGEPRVARVVGLAASVPFDKSDPRNPINRRISIVVLNRKADAQMSTLEPPEASPTPLPASVAGGTVPGQGAAGNAPPPDAHG
jgi:chemotaxis protein MotB